jgi:RNA recognition motif-containing protein
MSRGMGVVEFSNAADAQQAIWAMHETELDGRTIYVREDIIGTNQARGEARSRAPLRDWDDAGPPRRRSSAPPPSFKTRGSGSRERRREARAAGGDGRRSR